MLNKMKGFRRKSTAVGLLMAGFFSFFSLDIDAAKITDFMVIGMDVFGAFLVIWSKYSPSDNGVKK